MIIALIFWYLFFAISGVIISVKSIQKSRKNKNLVNIIFSICILSFVIVAEIILYNIFVLEAYPTFLPHYILLTALFMFSLQIWIDRKSK